MHNFDYFAAHAAIQPPAQQAPGANDPLLDLLLEHAEDCRTGVSTRGKEIHRNFVHQLPPPAVKPAFQRTVLERGLQLLREMGMEEAPGIVPPQAALLEFKFTLEKRFLSRDDSPFYPTENPVRKDKVFKVPMYPGSGWKGSLRAAAVELLVEKGGANQEKAEGRFSLTQLFGDEKGLDELEEPGEDSKKKGNLASFLDERLGPEAKRIYRELMRNKLREGDTELETFHRKGRVCCSPSYFDGIDLDVINPRKRDTRRGSMPIYYEVAPPGATARFALLYMPFDLPGLRDRTIKKDWELLGPALVRMLRESGFGAKKSSGCGRVKEDLEEARFQVPHLMVDERGKRNLEWLKTLAEKIRN